MGDYNIDLMKAEQHKPSMDFLNILYMYNMLPLIKKPTRITNTSASLIDNILSNRIQESIYNLQGILYSDISDHFPVFSINCLQNIMENEPQYINKRTISQRNMESFKHDCELTNWNSVYNEKDAQNAYTKYHKIISKLYDKHFPLKRCKVGYLTKLPWLTNGIKNRQKQKIRCI